MFGVYTGKEIGTKMLRQTSLQPHSTHSKRYKYRQQKEQQGLNRKERERPGD
jgi:hypothetical protein